MSHGANAPSYPPQQQRAPLTEPHSATGMTVLIDKIMGQLNLMKDEVTSKHDTPSGPTPSHLQLYKSHLLCIMNTPTHSGMHIHLSMLLTKLMDHPADSRAATSLYLDQRNDMYHHPMPLPVQRPKPYWSEHPSIQLIELALLPLCKIQASLLV